MKIFIKIVATPLAFVAGAVAYLVPLLYFEDSLRGSWGGLELKIWVPLLISLTVTSFFLNWIWVGTPFPERE